VIHAKGCEVTEVPVLRLKLMEDGMPENSNDARSLFFTYLIIAEY